MTIALDRPAGAVGRMATPTARLILPASAPRDEWLAARRDGLGSSDIPALMGVVEQRTPLHVYYDKLGALGDGDAGEAALWGTLHEDTVAREWARRNRSVGRRVGLVARDDEPWMRATLDRRIAECPLNTSEREVCALEVKTRSAWLASHWRRDVPDDVLAQVLWQIAVTGYDHIHVAVLIGGNDYRQRIVRRAGNEDVVADIVIVARRLWHDNIRAGVPPEVSGGEAITDLYNQIFPERIGESAADPDPDEALSLLDDYERGRLEESSGKKRKAAAKSKLVELLGDAEVAIVDDHEAYGYREQSKEHVDKDRLAERWPEAYADVVEDRPYRVISIAKPYRLKASDIEESA